MGALVGVFILAASMFAAVGGGVVVEWLRRGSQPR